MSPAMFKSTLTPSSDPSAPANQRLTVPSRPEDKMTLFAERQDHVEMVMMMTTVMVMVMMVMVLVKIMGDG